MATRWIYGFLFIFSSVYATPRYDADLTDEEHKKEVRRTLTDLYNVCTEIQEQLMQQTSVMVNLLEYLEPNKVETYDNHTRKPSY